jgi:nucleotide-binding universal stress UspA family protein
MNRNKLKILVLSDLKQNSKDTLKYASNLAKEFNGALELLCVKEPNETITTENPLSAMLNLSSTYIKTEQKLNKQIENITKEDFFPVKKIIEFGNVKNEIEKRIILPFFF